MSFRTGRESTLVFDRYFIQEIYKRTVRYPDKKKIHDIVRGIVRSESLSVTLESGDDSVSTKRPANKYLHYELGESPGENAPVEHKDADMVPVTKDSVVVAVWTEEQRTYRRYYDKKRFKEEFF